MRELHATMTNSTRSGDSDTVIRAGAVGLQGILREMSRFQVENHTFKSSSSAVTEEKFGIKGVVAATESSRIQTQKLWTERECEQ